MAIVGSGPSSLENDHGFIDSHDVVIRVNNYRTLAPTGYRTDIYYSFFGTSIRKKAKDLIADGVKLCMCKCPDAQIIKSHWHEQNRKIAGVDFRYIYEKRKTWWFCDTYVPTVENYMILFNLLGGHNPTTGFAAIFNVLGFNPSSIYITGFDFFTSGWHNIFDRWERKNIDDPVGHVPEVEMQWIRDNIDQFSVDKKLKELLRVNDD